MVGYDEICARDRAAEEREEREERVRADDRVRLAATVRTGVRFDGPGPGRDPRLHRHLFTASLSLGRADRNDPATVTWARAVIGAAMEKHAADLGFFAKNWSWTTAPGVLASGEVELRLQAEMAPRGDGEWPALRRALAEDVGDREFARERYERGFRESDWLDKLRAEWVKPELTYRETLERATADQAAILWPGGSLPQDRPSRPF